MDGFVPVARVGELRRGEAKVVRVGETAIALYNVEGAFYATQGACPHEGGPLGEGALEADEVTCPWHGWRFNVKTGKGGPGGTALLKTFPVKVEGGRVLVALSP